MSNPTVEMRKPSEDDIREIMESVRYDDDEDVQNFLNTFSEDDFWSARTSTKNTALHYMAANGFHSLLETTLKLKSAQPGSSSDAFISCLSAFNEKASSCLHWAALTGQLDCIKLLCERMESFPSTATYIMPAKKPRTLLTDILNSRNEAKRTPFDEAEVALKEDVVIYLLSKMDEIENPETSNAADGTVNQNETGDEEIPVDDEETEIVLSTKHEPLSPTHSTPVDVNISQMCNMKISDQN